MSTEYDAQEVHDKLVKSQKVLHYQFRDLKLLELCLTHASVAKTRLHSNERLEFLGDAVLGLCVCQMLYEECPNSTEGEMTRLKSALVSRNTCARVAEQFRLEDCLLLGKGLMMTNQLPQSIKAAVIETLIGGVYLDGGLDEAAEVIRRLFRSEIKEIMERSNHRNYKSILQHHCQKAYAQTPSYQLLDEKGPDHSKCFQIAVVIGPRAFPAAWGASKKSAEQQAAHNAIEILMEENTFTEMS